MSGDLLGDLALMIADANKAVMYDEPRLGPGVGEARRRICATLDIQRNDTPDDAIRRALAHRLALAGPDWPSALSSQFHEECRERAALENDPELLDSVDRIRFAEDLIRHQHKWSDEDWLLWGNLADSLNEIAHTPELRAGRQDWPAFNRMARLATGYIRAAGASPDVVRRLLRQWFAPARPAWLYGGGCCIRWSPADGCPEHTGRPAMSTEARRLNEGN